MTDNATRMQSERKKRDDFRAKMESKHFTEALPRKARDLIWDKAWDDGHSSGYHDVESHYSDLADIAAAAREKKP